MFAGRKYRLELDLKQRVFAERLGGICRSVWNTGLEQRRTYRRRGSWIGYAEQCRQLAEAKADFAWLAEAPAQVIQQTLKDLDRACSDHGTWRVHWKSKGKAAPSFRFPTPAHIPVERVNRKWGRVYLPKFGWVRFRLSRPLSGAVRSATVSRDGRHWFISFLVDDLVQEPEGQAIPNTPIGVDRGVVSAAVTSDGEFFDRRYVTHDSVSSAVPPAADKAERVGDLGYLKRGEAERYQRLQRRLARSKRGGRGRSATRAHLSEIMRRVRWRRADFNAQTAHRLTRDHDTIVLEGLNTGNMTRSAKGSTEAPGKQVAQKAGLNKAILDKGWYGLEVALRSKARYTGTVIAKVPAPYTSQTCPAPACKVVDGKSRKSQALFSCTACGHTEHADIVGAKNTLAKYRAAGLAVPGRGDPSGSAKRQAPRSTARAA